MKKQPLTSRRLRSESTDESQNLLDNPFASQIRDAVVSVLWPEMGLRKGCTDLAKNDMCLASVVSLTLAWTAPTTD